MGHFGREGRHALRGHPMIAGENHDFDALYLGRMAALPGGQPFGDVFQPAEGAAGFGQLRLALPRKFARLIIPNRQGLQ